METVKPASQTMLDVLRDEEEAVNTKRRRQHIGSDAMGTDGWDEEEEEEDADEGVVEAPRLKRRVKRNKSTPVSVTVKEEGGGGGGGGKPPHHRKEKMTTLEQTTRALGPMVQQYQTTETYNEINTENTHHIHSIIRELEEYVYGMYSEGQVTLVLFNYCHRLIEAVNHWNGSVRSEQSNMRDFVLNAISYNKELHDLYIEQTKRVPGTRNKRNPASPFNTVQVSPDSITLSSTNHALISASGTNNNTNDQQQPLPPPPLTTDGPPHMKNIF